MEDTAHAISGPLTTSPIVGSSFGGIIDASDNQEAFFAAVQHAPEKLLNLLLEHDGLLVIKGLTSINNRPDHLVTLSSVFGPEVENYADTPTPRHMIHEAESQILVISNMMPYDRPPPPPPDPLTTAEGAFPVQFPQRRGWHTDQSFRRPPPDISLFYGVIVTPKGQGQTLYANGYQAFADLPASTQEQIRSLHGLHALLGTGRSESAVRAGDEPKPLLPHQQSQQQPLVRIHPVTQRPALYLCEYGQMDWLDGPIVGMKPGPDGDGARLLKMLITHYTQPQYTYVHDWEPADLVIYDNRNLIHSATWYDADRHNRLMWRTTVHGNPGPEYAGEHKSWLPAEGEDILAGLDEARWDYSANRRFSATSMKDEQ